jgi:acetyl esterase/lipase
MTEYRYDINKRQIIKIFKPNEIKAPAFFYVHGGAWISSCINDFEYFGQRLASNGIICILAEYRLTEKSNPGIVHPDHCDDVKKGLDCSIKELEKLQQWNGELYLGGHSAGAFMTCFVLSQSKPDDRIKGWIGIEGIYSIEKLAEKYPSYVDWFLIHVFPNQTDWPLLTLSPPSVPSYVLHSEEDELVDFSLINDFVQQKSVKVVKLMGNHDDVLTSDLLFESLVQILKAQK